LNALLAELLYLGRLASGRRRTALVLARQPGALDAFALALKHDLTFKLRNAGDHIE
jgi:hypothetical protein